MKKVRIYGRVVNRWYSVNERGIKKISQYEVAYRDYDVDTCELLATGTEDFSRDRYDSEQLMLSRFVYTWDGQKRNKGGYRWFESQHTVGYKRRDSKLVKEYLHNKYPAAEMIQIRG